MYTTLQASFLLLCSSFAIGLNDNISDINIYHIFSSDYVTSEPDNVLRNAVQWINRNTSLINGRKLLLNSMDMCYQDSDDELFNLIKSQTIAVVIDGTCPAGSNLVKEISQRSGNTLHVRYPPTPDYNHQQNYSNSSVNMYPSTNIFGTYLSELVAHFGWSNIGVINELELVEVSTEDLRFRIILLENSTHESDIFDEETIVYIVVSKPAVLADILCKAYEQGVGYPNEMFIIPYWFGLEWIRENSTCSDIQLLSVLNNTLAVDLEPPTTETIDKLLMTLALQTSPNTTLSNYSIDSVWTIANILNETLTHDDEISKDDIFQFQLNTLNTSGLTGQIHFNENGERPTSQMGVYQFRDGEYIKVLTVSNEGLMFENNSGTDESASTILPGMLRYVEAHVAVGVIFMIIAVIGIIFTTVCLIFNIMFRNKKMLKLSSPNLNFLIIIGSFWLYITAIYIIINRYFTEYETRFNVICSLSFTTTFSLSLCDGTIQGKMFRIFYIFYNPSSKKKRIKDKYIFIYVGVLLVIDLVTYIVIMSHPTWRPTRVTFPSSQGVETNALGVNITNSIYTCNSENPTDYAIRAALVYGFRIILNLVSLILAILSCFRVKHKAVNDAKSVMAIIYINTAFAIIAATTSVLFTQDANVILSLGCLSVIVIPTSILFFTFVPKMVAVYKDPDAKSVFSLQSSNFSPKSGSG